MQHVTTVILNALHKNYSFITCRSKMEKTTTRTLHALRCIELLSQLKIDFANAMGKTIVLREEGHQVTYPSNGKVYLHNLLEHIWGRAPQ